MRVRRRAIATSIVVVIVAAGVATATSPSVSAALGGLLLRDPTLSIAPPSTATAGSVVALRPNAPLGSSAYVLFSDASGTRALTPAFATATGDAVAVAPTILSGGRPSQHSLSAQLVVRTGLLWRGSNTVNIAVAPPANVAAAVGATTLFYLDVGRVLTSEMARRAGAARELSPTAASAYATAATAATAKREVVRSALAAKVSGDARPLSLEGGTLSDEELASLDALVAGHLVGLGPASPSPCGEAKDADVAAVLTGQAASDAAISERAARYASAVLGCPDEQLRDLMRRTAGWISSVIGEVATIAKAPFVSLFQHTAVTVGEGYIEQAGWRGAVVQATLGGNETELSDILASMVGAQPAELSYYSAIYKRLDASGANWAFELDLYRAQAHLHTQIDKAAADPRQRMTVERLLEILDPGIARAGASPSPTAARTTLPPTPAVLTASPAPSSTSTPSPTPIATPAPTATATPPPVPPPTAPPVLTATVAPARDLTGTWRGGFASTGHFQGSVNCRWSGSLTLVLTQSGNTLSGQATLTYGRGQAVLAGAECAGGQEQYAVTGTASSSSLRFTFNGGDGAWYGTSAGSFTTDLMSGTFAGSGADYGTGCFQVSRTGVGAIPNCSQ